MRSHRFGRMMISADRDAFPQHEIPKNTAENYLASDAPLGTK
jgi:hypothetical protein